MLSVRIAALSSNITSKECERVEKHICVLGVIDIYHYTTSGYAYFVSVPIIKANEMHNFSNLFDKVLYVFRTVPLSIISSISTLYTRNRYLPYYFCRMSASVVRMTTLADIRQK